MAKRVDREPKGEYKCLHCGVAVRWHSLAWVLGAPGHPAEEDTDKLRWGMHLLWEMYKEGAKTKEGKEVITWAGMVPTVAVCHPCWNARADAASAWEKPKKKPKKSTGKEKQVDADKD